MISKKTSKFFLQSFRRKSKKATCQSRTEFSLHKMQGRAGLHPVPTFRKSKSKFGRAKKKLSKYKTGLAFKNELKERTTDV